MKEVIELTQNNCTEYIKGILENLPFVNPKVVSVEEITEQTYVNWIFKAVLDATDGQKTVYIRQSRGFVKKKPDIKVDPERIEFESKILDLLQSIQPGVTPEVLFFDKENNVCVLSDIKGEGELLVNELVSGRAHPETGRKFGEIVASFHGPTFGIANEEVRGSRKENDDAINFHMGMRLEPALKEFPKETSELLEISKKAKHCLVLGDLASKNIFVDGEDIRFLDLERAFIGDPAFDIAFLFCHYLLEIPFEKVDLALEFIDNFMGSYGETMKKYISDEEMKVLDNRIIRFLGIMILYRLFGFYLVIKTDQNGERWKEIAYTLLTEEKETFVLKMLKGLIFN